MLLASAAVLFVIVLSGLVVPSASTGDQVTHCPYRVNQNLGMQSRWVQVPTDFDMCVAWHTRSGLPVYPVKKHPLPLPVQTCEQWLTELRNGQKVAERLPPSGPKLYQALHYTEPFVAQVQGGYRVRFKFKVPTGAELAFYKPWWPNMTAKQVDTVDRFFRLSLPHERGHENLLGRLSTNFSLDALIPAKDQSAATAEAYRRADAARLGIAEDDEILTGEYDYLTEHGYRQGRVGGTDEPRILELDPFFCELLPVTSTFESNDEGWRATGDILGNQDPAGYVPTRHSSGGNPGGYVEIHDLATGDVWYWKAPKKFLGNRSDVYGKLLKFDLKQSATDRHFDNVDVWLIGGGGVEELGLRIGQPPGTNWTHYAVRLDATNNWVDEVSHQPATTQQIQNVLGALSALEIRGEYRTGVDVGGLDSVSFGASQ